MFNIPTAPLGSSYPQEIFLCHLYSLTCPHGDLLPTLTCFLMGFREFHISRLKRLKICDNFFVCSILSRGSPQKLPSVGTPPPQEVVILGPYQLISQVESPPQPQPQPPGSCHPAWPSQRAKRYLLAISEGVAHHVPNTFRFGDLCAGRPRLHSVRNFFRTRCPLADAELVPSDL